MVRLDAYCMKDLLHQFVAEKDEGAFASLVDRHAGLVFSVALRKTSDSAEAEEISQNVFSLLAGKAPQLVREFDEATIARWLHRTAVFESRNFVRKEINRSRHMKEFAENEKGRVEGVGAQVADELGSSLDDAIDRLPEKDREVVMLRFYEGESFQSIGRLLGKSDDAAQKQATRAVEKLRGILGRMGVSVPAAALATALPANLAQAAPSWVASSVSQAALAASPALASGGIASALFIMSSNKIPLIASAALVALIAVPAAIRQDTIAALEKRIAEAEVIAGVSPGGTPEIEAVTFIRKAGAVPLSQRDSSRENSAVDLDDLMDRMLTAQRAMDFSEMLRLQSTIESLSVATLKEGIARVAERDYSPTQTEEIRSAFLTRLGRKEPHIVLDWTMENRESYSAAASALGVLAGQDSEAALEWLNEARRSGILEGRGAEDNNEAEFAAEFLAGLAKEDFEAAREMMSDFGPAAAREGARKIGVGLAMNGGDSKRLFSILETLESTRDRAEVVMAFSVNLSERDPDTAKAAMVDAGLPPEDFNFAIREFAGATVMVQPKRQAETLEWMIRESSRESLGENVEHYVQEWMTANRKGAMAWANSLEKQSYRDDAIAGVASWYRLFGKGDEATIWINQIADETRRNELVNKNK